MNKLEQYLINHLSGYKEDFQKSSVGYAMHPQFLKAIFKIWLVKNIPVFAFFAPLTFCIKQYMHKRKFWNWIVLCIMIIISSLHFYFKGYVIKNEELFTFGLLYETRTNDSFELKDINFELFQKAPYLLNYTELGNYLSTEKEDVAIFGINNIEQAKRFRFEMILFPIVSALLLLLSYVTGLRMGKSFDNR